MAKKKYSNKPKRDIYQEVTDRIIHCLEQGTAPWKNPIKRGTGDGWPKNMDSGKRYRGINVFLLGLTAWESGFSSDYWMTFNQAKSHGGQVRKGEKGSLVTFFKMYAAKDKETGESIEIPMLKHFTAFNVEQIDGIDIPDAPADHGNAVPFEPLVEAECVVNGYGAIAETVKIKNTGGQGSSPGLKTKKAFTSNGIKVQVAAKKKATQAEIAEVLELWLAEHRNDGRSKAA